MPRILPVILFLRNCSSQLVRRVLSTMEWKLVGLLLSCILRCCHSRWGDTAYRRWGYVWVQQKRLCFDLAYAQFRPLVAALALLRRPITFLPYVSLGDLLGLAEIWAESTLFPLLLYFLIQSFLSIFFAFFLHNFCCLIQILEDLTFVEASLGLSGFCLHELCPHLVILVLHILRLGPCWHPLCLRSCKLTAGGAYWLLFYLMSAYRLVYLRAKSAPRYLIRL